MEGALAPLVPSKRLSSAGLGEGQSLPETASSRRNSAWKSDCKAAFIGVYPERECLQQFPVYKRFVFSILSPWQAAGITLERPICVTSHQGSEDDRRLEGAEVTG